jgi:hypothetical protein
VLQTLPALKRVVVPRPTREVLVEVVIAVRQDVEPSALLIGDDRGVGVHKLLAELDVEQGGVERPAP